jgi:ectoine hydroxylase-related dioxygenase (phytanoyl-CoA dioxygenase family)
VRRLSAEERRIYDAQGYVVVPGVFPADELEAIDREIDRLLAAPGNDAGGIHPTWIFQVARRSEMAREFAEDERLLALIEDIVQPGIAIHSTKLVPKPPHSNDVCHWHQDDAYYIRPNDPGTYSQTRMSVWVPLQDAHERNGGLWVVPGSQQWGLQDSHMVDTGQCRKVIDREAEAEEHAIPLRVSAGSVVLFSAMLWHHSKNNTTDRIRRAFIVSYQEATVPKGAGEQWKILRSAGP